jgi:ABC-type nitrate/sulfonate/bicarbonate transport system substrate-binding protein
MAMRTIAFLILALGLSFSVSAQESVVVSYDGYAGFQGPLWAAKDLGLFKKHGLNAEMVLITGSTRGMAALISGSTDFAQGRRARLFPSVCGVVTSRLSPRRSIDFRLAW